jgi:predicted RNase H-like HicB family nuclease/DNA-binding XRE family transcriptional regulator
MIKYQMKVNAEDDRYWAEFPDLPECFTQGDTLEELLKNAREALDLYLDDAKNPEWKLPAVKIRKGEEFVWVYPSARVTIAIRIRQARLEKGLSQSELADLLGIKKQQIQKLESPLKSNPTVDLLDKITQVLGTHLFIDFAD